MFSGRRGARACRCKNCDLPLIIGAELRCVDGLKLVALAVDRRSYGKLSRLISKARRASAKGSYALLRSDLEAGLEGCLILWLPAPGHPQRADAGASERDGGWLRERFVGRLWIGVEMLTTGFDTRRLASLQALGRVLELPCVAAGDVHMHRRSRRALQDVLTAIRLNTPLQEVGYALFPNGERCLRPLQRLRELYPAALLDETLRIAERCHFKLDELRYEYPQEIVPEGETPTSHLRTLTERGARERWPEGVPEAARSSIEHELRLIAELEFEPFFLTVHDVVRHARAQKSCVRVAARPLIPWSAIACRSRRWTLRACRCCSSASFPRNATSRPTSTSTSSTSGARR